MSEDSSQTTSAGNVTSTIKPQGTSITMVISNSFLFLYRWNLKINKNLILMLVSIFITFGLYFFIEYFYI